jgi:hypothetical protein
MTNVPRADVHHDLSIVALSSKAVVDQAKAIVFPEAEGKAAECVRDFIQDTPLAMRATRKARHYRDVNRAANTAEICVPVLVTTGGTTHSEFNELLDSLTPYTRRFLSIRISVLLQKARVGLRLDVGMMTACTIA